MEQHCPQNIKKNLASETARKVIEAYQKLSEEKRLQFSAMYIEKENNTCLPYIKIEEHVDILNKLGTTININSISFTSDSILHTPTKKSLRELSASTDDNKESAVQNGQLLTSRLPSERTVDCQNSFLKQEIKDKRSETPRGCSRITRRR